MCSSQLATYITYVSHHPPGIIYSAGHVHVFNTTSRQWSKHTVLSSSELVLCRHSATALPNHASIIYLGGGMNCFGFGTTFSPLVLLDLTSLAPSTRPHQSTSDVGLNKEMNSRLTAQNGPDLGAQTSGQRTDFGTRESNAAAAALTDHEYKGHVPSSPVWSSADHAHSSLSDHVSQPVPSIGPGQQEADHKKGLAVERLQAKLAKDALKALGWLDQSCKAQTDTAGEYVCLPLTDEAAITLLTFKSSSSGTAHSSNWSSFGVGSHDDQSCTVCHDSDQVAASGNGQHQPDDQTGLAASQPVSNITHRQIPATQNGPKGVCQTPKGISASMKGTKGANVATVLALLQEGLAVVKPMQAQASLRHAGGPAKRLKLAVTDLLQQQVRVVC